MQIITNQFQKELKQHGNEQFPFLVSYQKLSEYESGSFMWHWHPEIEITYVQKGTMCYKVNHMVCHLKEGDIVFNNSGALHSGTMENQKDCAYIPVTFDSRLIYGFFQSTEVFVNIPVKLNSVYARNGSRCFKRHLLSINFYLFYQTHDTTSFELPLPVL